MKMLLHEVVEQTSACLSKSLELNCRRESRSLGSIVLFSVGALPVLAVSRTKVFDSVGGIISFRKLEELPRHG